MGSSDETKRRRLLNEEAERRLIKKLTPQKSGVWTISDVRTIFGGMWDLYRVGSGVNVPGEIVCRHVAAALCIALRQDGYKAYVDSFLTKPVPGSPYGGHATLVVKFEDDWYYVESDMGIDGYHNVGRSSLIPRNRRGFDGTELEGLPMTLDGSKQVDVGWMNNRSNGRELTSFRVRVDDRTLSVWHREYQKQKAYVFHEVYDRSAYGLVGRGKGKRKVLS